MSTYAIIHDQDGRVRCCNADGSGGAPYNSIQDAETAIKRCGDPRPVIRICDHLHDRAPDRETGYSRCARTDKPCAIQP